LFLRLSYCHSFVRGALIVKAHFKAFFIPIIRDPHLKSILISLANTLDGFVLTLIDFAKFLIITIHLLPRSGTLSRNQSVGIFSSSLQLSLCLNAYTSASPFYFHVSVLISFRLFSLSFFVFTSFASSCLPLPLCL
jgi:hypothetical protein